MLELLPFLYTTLALGVTFFLILSASAIILTVPVFATRGTTQVIWLGVVGFLLTAETATLVTLGILNSQGNLWN